MTAPSSWHASVGRCPDSRQMPEKYVQACGYVCITSPRLLSRQMGPEGRVDGGAQIVGLVEADPADPVARPTAVAPREVDEVVTDVCRSVRIPLHAEFRRNQGRRVASHALPLLSLMTEWVRASSRRVARGLRVNRSARVLPTAVGLFMPESMERPGAPADFSCREATKGRASQSGGPSSVKHHGRHGECEHRRDYAEEQDQDDQTDVIKVFSKHGSLR